MSADKLSIEERVNTAYRRMILIQAAANVQDDIVDEDVLLAAIAEVAQEVAVLLDPITQAPGEIIGWSPK